MHKFFVEQNQIKGNIIKIIGDDVKHITQVLRLNIGEEILICDGQRMGYCCIIKEIDKSFINVTIKSTEELKSELATKIYLFQGIPKGDKMDLIIQKSVELGVYKIIPVSMQRSVVKLNGKNSDKKIARWNKISLAAAKQAARGIIPEVTEPLSLKEAVNYASKLEQLLVPYENAKGISHSKNLLLNLKSKSSIGIFIGPEGGFDESEIITLKENHADIVTLGNRILRTETASLAALSIIMFSLEDDIHGN